MIALPSEIQLEKFAVIQSHYEFNPPRQSPKNIQDLFKSYEVDIDFAHHINEDKTIQVFTKISVNQNDNPCAGYKLFVEGVAVFSLGKTVALSEEEEKNLKFYSTVNILIGYLRNTLTAITSSSPMGPYLLPPLNVTDLFRKKSESKQSE